jgi:hypothetical protein
MDQGGQLAALAPQRLEDRALELQLVVTEGEIELVVGESVIQMLLEGNDLLARASFGRLAEIDRAEAAWIERRLEERGELLGQPAGANVGDLLHRSVAPKTSLAPSR